MCSNVSGSPTETCQGDFACCRTAADQPIDQPQTTTTTEVPDSGPINQGTSIPQECTCVKTHQCITADKNLRPTNAIVR